MRGATAGRRNRSGHFSERDAGVWRIRQVGWLMRNSPRGAQGLEAVAKGLATIEPLNGFRDAWIHWELARWWRAELLTDSELPPWIQSGPQRAHPRVTPAPASSP